MTTMTPTLTRPITDEEVLALEQSYWDAIKERDARNAGRLTAEQCTVAGASGASVVDPRGMAKLIESATYRINDFRIEPQSVQVNHISDDVVAISYGVHEDLDVDGRPVKLDAFDSSVWKQTDNGWVCVLHTESIEGDAYGRDRMQGRSTS